jgi:xanthine dehydrogenase molybdenum-binding subunit
MSELSVVGKSIPKIDAKEKVTGRAMYVDDIKLPGMLYGKIVRCMEYAHARVKGLDFSEAKKVPGVIKVLGPKDVCSNGYNSGAMDVLQPEMICQLVGELREQHIFTEHVKHQGDAICGVIAKTEEIAEQASKKIRVDYEPLPVYMNAEAAKQPDAVQFTPEKPGNIAFTIPEAMFPGGAFGHDDVDAVIDEADVIVEDMFYVPKVKQCQMEPHAYIAHYDHRDRLNCWTSTQMPKPVQRKLAELFDIPMTRVKINQAIIGGAFGGRLGFVGEPAACAMAMAVPGRPVKVNYTREEDWIASESRHPGDYWMKLGFKKDGTPVFMDAKFTGYKGGYYSHGLVPWISGILMRGVYKWGAFRFKADNVFTNQVPCGAFRGFGNPQANFPIEQLIDRACNQLGIDPVAWRTKWHKVAGDDAWGFGMPIISCAADACLEKGAEAFGWKEKRGKYAKQTGTKRRGVGVSIMSHCSGGFPVLLEHTVTTVIINEDCTADVLTACTDLGCGAHTALKQMAAEALGFPLEDVHLSVQDSDAAAYDVGSHASRTITIGGGSVVEACKDAVRQILERAATLLEANPEDLEMKDKKAFVKGSPDKSVDLKDMLTWGIVCFPNPMTGQYDVPPGQIHGYSSYHPMLNTLPYDACFVEVEVDTETGEVKLIDSVVAHDIGRAVHPPSVEGQLEGGLQQGIGMALTEETYYDANGLCLNNSFTDYKMLGPSDMPKCKVILVEEPDPATAYGVKSVGEGGCVAPVGATANAIYNALGIQFTEAPITPEKILKAIKEKGLK